MEDIFNATIEYIIKKFEELNLDISDNNSKQPPQSYKRIQRFSDTGK